MREALIALDGEQERLRAVIETRDAQIEHLRDGSGGGDDAARHAQLRERDAEIAELKKAREGGFAWKWTR